MDIFWMFFLGVIILSAIFLIAGSWWARRKGPEDRRPMDKTRPPEHLYGPHSGFIYGPHTDGPYSTKDKSGDGGDGKVEQDKDRAA